MNDTMWGLPAFIAAGHDRPDAGAAAVAIALWRGRVVRWWAFAAVLGGYAAFMFSSVMWLGLRDHDRLLHRLRRGARPGHAVAASSDSADGPGRIGPAAPAVL